MRIVVLDGYTLNPGDLSWDRLKELGEVTIYDRTSEQEIINRAQGADILLTNKTPLTGDTIRQLPELRYIGVLATGYNVVDIDVARERGITVTNVPAYSTYSVAQMVLALLLEICHHVQDHSNGVRNGRWSQSADFCYWDYPLVELAGKTMGIIGFGRIGRRVAAIAAAMGMKVIAASRSKRDTPLDIEHFKWVDIPQLLREADVISLHCPLLPETQGLINKDAIRQMKPTAILINTARGGVVVDEDLAQALNEGRIYGAGLDVLSVEPPRADNPLLSAKNCFITPHIAWATKEARVRLMDTTVDNIKAYLAGQPINVVNP
ncbi:MAG: D-2-hydroxyacid dehydrogenase [Mahellales bacterium]|jgi:glycerate dehydrogenase